MAIFNQMLFNQINLIKLIIKLLNQINKMVQEIVSDQMLVVGDETRTKRSNTVAATQQLKQMKFLPSDSAGN